MYLMADVNAHECCTQRIELRNIYEWGALGARKHFW